MPCHILIDELLYVKLHIFKVICSQTLHVSAPNIITTVQALYLWS